MQPRPGRLPERTELGPIVALSLTLIVSWSVWAVGLLPLLPARSSVAESLIGVAARCVFWLVPCGLYLWRYWGNRWYEPIGFAFPFGWRQVATTAALTSAVTVLLVLGTSIQKAMPVSELLSQLFTKAGPNLRAPFFEELVFRGVVLSELLNWNHDNSRSRAQLKTRFWLALLGSALVFLWIHWPWWLSHHGLTHTLELSLPVLFTGIVLGGVYANTRSLWGVVFLHWLNNELSALT